MAFNKKQPVKNKKKKKVAARSGKIHLPIAIAVFLLIILSISGFAIWYFSFQDIHFEDYLTISYTGYNGKGSAVLDFDADSSFLETVSYHMVTPNGNLSNGDTLEVSFDYDKDLASQNWLRIRSDSYQVEVTGLNEATPLTVDDVFKDIIVSYEGIAPELMVSFQNQSSNPFLQQLSYEIVDAKSYYDIGESFTIQAAISEEDALLHEYRLEQPLEQYACTYTVENGDRYIRDISELSTEQIHTLNVEASSLINGADANEYGQRIFTQASHTMIPLWVNGKLTFVWSNPRLISAYLNILNPEYFGEVQSHDNDVKLVYIATLSQADGLACDAEVVVQFTNLMKKEDGSYDLAIDSGKIIAASYKNSHIAGLVKSAYDEEYISEKIILE